jgi:hypothetical protein
VRGRKLAHARDQSTEQRKEGAEIMFKINLQRKHVQSNAIVLVCLLMAGVFLLPTVAADTWNKKTIVTFNTPVEIPGKVLPAGTYVFKLLDSASNRHIVQIFDKDEKQLYATILALPNYRLQPADKPILSFEERPAGTPEALKAWFYPGDNFGQQFVYPQERAVQLAKQHNQHVLAMPNDMSKHITAKADTAKAPSVQSLQKTDVTGVNPSGEPVALEVTVAVTPEGTKR